ncbi:MAG: peptidoglycan DD-metalloendopeptidase family protein [Anaerolineales bacterium]|nr:peptidoglycan DD-metalloendopeptidase family protein [Anaerolineales bacterium]
MSVISRTTLMLLALVLITSACAPTASDTLPPPEDTATPPAVSASPFPTNTSPPVDWPGNATASPNTTPFTVTTTAFVAATQTSTPPPTLGPPSGQLFPDAEVVYSPTGLDFNTGTYLQTQQGFLSSYRQYLMINGWNSGADLIDRIALENSINPRLLLALLEYQSGCVLGQPELAEDFSGALGAKDYYRQDLYGQLIWAVHELSLGYYGWRMGALTEISLIDGKILPLQPELNAGTVAIQYFFAQLYGESDWHQVLDPETGFPALYERMFGDPWVRAASYIPIIPDHLTQPELSLPFEPGRKWAFTGGPHASFEGNGPLAALDFAPAIDEPGCYPSDQWVVAMADGLVVRSEDGLVIQDLDLDGNEQTGWNLMYLHIGTQNRVPVGSYVQAGGRIGHPSCEGGRATGTHVHIARKYNGEWIAADGPLPFVLDGWRAHNGSEPYLGTLTRADETVTAHVVGSIISQLEKDEP